MGQQEIYNLLSKSKKPLTQHEIAQKLKRCESTINHGINMMLKYKEVEFKIVEVPAEQRKKKTGNFHIRAFYLSKRGKK